VPNGTPSLGRKLSDARIERALSIEETAWRTRMRPDLLRALEQEEFDEVGPHGFVRSHLHSYARFLGMDPQEVLDEYEARTMDAPSAVEHLDRQERAAKRPPRAKWLIAAAVCGTMLFAASAAGLLGGHTDRPSARSLIAGALPPRLERGAASRSRPTGVEMKVTAVADTQLRIVADGVQIFEGIIPSGAVRSFAARSSLGVAATDGGAIRVDVNGKSYDTGVPHFPYRARFGPRGRLV